MHLAIALAITGLIWPTNPTVVKDTGNVMVESHVGNRSNTLRDSATYIDRYTHTKIVFGKCRPNTRCITVKLGTVPGPATGRTTGSYNRTIITIEPRVSARYWRYLFGHEMGHAFSLSHSSNCVSVMSPYLTCNGHPTTHTYTPAQRTILGRH